METLIHLFMPRHTNNFKAKILHPSTLLILAALVVVLEMLVQNVLMGRNILGYSANISPDEVVRITNEKRIQNGLRPLTVNNKLAAAAYTKGRHMIDNDYWAHVAPDGTQPWKFIADFGYKYRFAGENLARDFSNPASVVDAWMNSKTHRDNLLSSKYSEIGIGVVEGDLAGVDTTIVVQFFGAGYVDSQPVAPIARIEEVQQGKPETNEDQNSSDSAQPVETIVNNGQTDLVLSNVGSQNQKQTPLPVLIAPFNTNQTVTVISLSIIALLFVVDSFIVFRKRVTRITGKLTAHLSFLGILLIVSIILSAGKIL